MNNTTPERRFQGVQEENDEEDANSLSSHEYKAADDKDNDDDEDLDSSFSQVASSKGRRRQKQQQQQAAEREIRETIAKKEDHHVRKARLVTMIAVATCAALLSIAIYYFASAREQQAMQSAFTEFADHIVEFVQWETTYNFALIEHYANIVTMTAVLTNQTFPYVTHPHFEVNGGYVDGMGGIMAVFFAPLINGSEASRQEWQDYANQNRGWINASKNLKKAHPGHRDPLHGTMQDHEDDRRRRLQTAVQEQAEPLPDISPFIYRYNEDNGQHVPVVSNENTILAPLWQSSPANADAVNVDLLSDARIAKLYQAMMATRHRSVMSATTQITHLFDFLFDDVEKPNKKKPHAFLMEPVYANLLSSSSSSSSNNNSTNSSSMDPTDHADREPVGFLLGITVYENLLDRHFIPENVGGIIAVIHDTCGNNLTYQLDGPEATFVGEGDLHDTNFDDYVRFTPIEHYHIISPSSTNPAVDESDAITTETNATDLSGLCRHELFLYPSAEFQATYQTNTPMIYTLVIILAFSTTAIVFFVYDIFVSRRQEKTMQSALRTTAIISSLFPAAMRDRLLEEHQHKYDKEQQNKAAASAAADGDTDAKGNRTKDFNKSNINNHSNHMKKNSGGKGDCKPATTSNKQGENMTLTSSSSSISKSRPIADFFPNTTLLFADIVGFTSWSSKREPCQVFQLLETLYGEFDALAQRRRVFKVETVGDCYVAACGLPTPRKDHAVVMARFARDMHVKANQVLQKLAASLGPDTAELCFRVGLHSGAVMGGVLRGDNARFQLFGDAMNTAARMEHTGLAHKTHISATTAELLIEAGKQSWITPRDEKTFAKGLGELSTYWLHSLSTKAGSTSGGNSQSNYDPSFGTGGASSNEDDPTNDGQQMDDVISDIDDNEEQGEQPQPEEGTRTTLDRPEFVKTCTRDSTRSSPSTTN